MKKKLISGMPEQMRSYELLKCQESKVYFYNNYVKDENKPMID